MADEQLKQAESLLEELEQLEQQLEQMRAGLNRSHRLATLGTLAAIIAHEFNNILTPVMSYCQLALKGVEAGEPDEAMVRKALERSLGGSQKAARICESMLGFARASSDDGPKEADVKECLEDVLATLGRDPAKDNIKLSVDVPAGLSAVISPVSLQQVLLNLVLNARQVLRGRGGTLAITARRQRDQLHGDCVHITVADDGPGIPEELMHRLFEPFVTYRPPTPTPAPAPGSEGASGRSGSSSEESPGTGLGLTVCRDLVRRAGGEIEAQSAPGRGASFHITLPACG